MSLLPPALRRYLMSAPMPHLSALTCAAAGAALWGQGRRAAAEGEPLAAAFWLVAAGGMFWGSLLAEADGLCRYREYRRVRALLRRYGFRRRIFRATGGSRCQRDAALLAAAESGCRRRAARLYRELGYRWYHLIPDWVVGDPRHVLRPAFWRASFIPAQKGAR